MRVLRLDPGAAFKKCARVVGDVIGKFHPHGDQAVYDALVRLAQDFAQRYPLVDGQGNFGNVDGDNPAAMRYTEARLTEVAHLLLDGIDEDAIDFRPTYDGSENEPVVLPGAFPNLLANGSQGIAVGMATAIPPHNVAELCDAALHLIGTPNARSRTLLKYVSGPDFPTGGVILARETSPYIFWNMRYLMSLANTTLRKASCCLYLSSRRSWRRTTQLTVKIRGTGLRTGEVKGGADTAPPAGNDGCLRF